MLSLPQKYFTFSQTFGSMQIKKNIFRAQNEYLSVKILRVNIYLKFREKQQRLL